MSRVGKRFLYKIRMPVFVILGLLVVSSVIHIITDTLGSNFTEVVAVVLLFLFYLIGLAMIAVIPIALLLEAYGRARTEIKEENETMIKALRND
jgi:predicted membrane channel-forming protein YqfA (hemolysin III family)